MYQKLPSRKHCTAPSSNSMQSLFCSPMVIAVLLLLLFTWIDAAMIELGVSVDEIRYAQDNRGVL